MKIPFITVHRRWKKVINAYIATLGDSLSRVTGDNAYRDRRLDYLEETVKKHESALELLIADKVPTAKIGVKSKEDLEALKKDLPASPDTLEATPVPEGGAHCSIKLVKQKDKPKIKKLSLARKIVSHLACMGRDWSLESEVKERLLGEDAVKQGGGHFSRTLGLLSVRELVEFDLESTAVRLTEIGRNSAQLVWRDLREYDALVEE